MGKSESLPTNWEIPDDLWQRIEPVILRLDPPKAKGRKRVDADDAGRDHIPDA